MAPSTKLVHLGHDGGRTRVDSPIMADAILTDIAQPGAVTCPPPPLPYERGSCGNGRIHALRKTLNGPRAFCDPSLALARLGGRFDYDDLDSCLRCIIETAGRTITMP
jgi:hypothetical protein